ncbi:hypothetical protein IFM12275_68940 (plasmid) [Nocardia sputorum]|nr:hypothetical protein IFM12275_68940 [Nocardia sputorum]
MGTVESGVVGEGRGCGGERETETEQQCGGGWGKDAGESHGRLLPVRCRAVPIMTSAGRTRVWARRAGGWKAEVQASASG